MKKKTHLTATPEELAQMEPMYRITADAVQKHLPDANEETLTLIGNTFSLVSEEYLGKLPVPSEEERVALSGAALFLLGEILTKFATELFGYSGPSNSQKLDS